MSHLQLEIPDDLRAFLDSLRSDEGFTSESEFVCGLIREARRQRAKKHLEKLLREGLEGPFIELDEEEFQSIEAEAIKRLEGKTICP